MGQTTGVSSLRSSWIGFPHSLIRIHFIALNSLPHFGQRRMLVYVTVLRVLVFHINNNFHLIFRVLIRRDALDANFINVIETHVQKLGNVMVVTARNEAKLEFAKINRHRIGVELIVRFPDKVKASADLQLVKRLRTIPIAESGNVEIGQMDFLNGSVFFCFHKACILIV